MSSTGVKEYLIDYALFFNDTTCLSSLNISGLTIFQSASSFNNSLNILFYDILKKLSYGYNFCVYL